MTPFSVKLSDDETNAALDIAKKTGKAPNQALAEMAVATALHRQWHGTFEKVDGWKIWQQLGISCSEIRVYPTMYVSGTLVVRESDTDAPTVLVIDRSAPTYTLAGWITGKTAKQEKYWDAASKTFCVPQANLRQCWELRKERRNSKRIHKNDPADDFAGNGRWPQMRDADDGSLPSKLGAVIPSSHDAPCLRCQTMIPKGALVGGNVRTGTIHGDPAECGYFKKGRSA